jgi:hypothetical protein
VIESVQVERKLVMIPASYLYKDAYKQHWGEDFVRLAGEDARQPEPSTKRSLLQAIGSVMVRAFTRATPGQNAVQATEATASEPHCSAMPA